MKFTIVGAISSMVALPAVAGATAPQAPAVPPGQSFSDLLQPISDPVQKLRASDAQEIARSRGVELIQTRWHHTTITITIGEAATAIPMATPRPTAAGGAMVDTTAAVGRR
ncbi:MAG TPA: hypothetical protein VHX64_07415 [Caulobacteraceae bacterium]|nr:hypothetical protein [Caulobacteraceae bacterium]